jgi:hypothetical protein
MSLLTSVHTKFRQRLALAEWARSTAPATRDSIAPLRSRFFLRNSRLTRSSATSDENFQNAIIGYRRGG